MKEQVALALDNQRVSNETMMNETDTSDFYQEYSPFFYRISIPVIRRSLDPSSFVGFQLGLSTNNDGCRTFFFV